MCAKQEMCLPGNTVLITSTEVSTLCTVAFYIIVHNDIVIMAAQLGVVKLVFKFQMLSGI
jgi:hypothetical protein